MRRQFTAVLLMVFTLPVFGQVSIVFMPELHGRNVDGLLNCRINNAGPSSQVYLSIAVSEPNGRKVCEIVTRPFSLVRGTTPIPAMAVNKTSIRFGNTNNGNFTRQNGYFPQGEYEYTFSLYSVQTQVLLIEQRFDFQLEPLTELLLTEPYNKDEICNTKPLLSWQPSLPGIQGSSYMLILSEIKGNQTAVEALNYNYPVINQNGINAPVLVYPAISKELQKGKKYAWQVTAYKNQTILNRSEVWEFTVNCQDTVEAETLSDIGYRDIEDLLKGNYYIATGSVKFSLMNSYESQKLNYRISCITDPKKKVKNLPGIKLTRGKNMISMDFQNNRSFISGYYYLLHVEMPNGAQKKLRILYK